MGEMGRRELLNRSLKVSAGLGLSGVALGSGSDSKRQEEVWTSVLGRPVGDQPYGSPSDFEKLKRSVYKGSPFSTNSFTPLQDLHGSITPSGLHFERHHAGIPNIDPVAHRLLIHGNVKRNLSYSMDDLHRFPSLTRVAFIECSGNAKNAVLSNRRITCAPKPNHGT